MQAIVAPLLTTAVSERPVSQYGAALFVTAEPTSRLARLSRQPTTLRQRIAGILVAALAGVSLLWLQSLKPQQISEAREQPISIQFVTEPAPTTAAFVAPTVQQVPDAPTPPTSERPPEVEAPPPPQAEAPPEKLPPQTPPASIPSIVTAKPVEARPPAKPVSRRPQISRPITSNPSPQQPAIAARPEAQVVASDMATFESALRHAVQDALLYPAAARLAKEGGDVRVAFDFADGHASNAAVVRSSGLPILDHAALATLARTHYPPASEFLARQLLHLTLLVQFRSE